MAARLLLVLGLVLALPLGAGAQENAIFQLVGFTSATFDGGQGRFTYTAACGAEWENTRMCTTQEIIQTIDVPALSGSHARVQPVVAGGANGAVDASGFSWDKGANCSDWSYGGPGAISTTVVTSSGQFVSGDPLSPCQNSLPIACCGLVAITPQPPPAATMVPLWVLPIATGGLLGAGVVRAGKRKKHEE